MQREDLGRGGVKRDDERAKLVWGMRAYLSGVGDQKLGAAGCTLLVLALEVLDFDLLESGLPLKVGGRLVWDDGRVRRGGGERFLFF